MSISQSIDAPLTLRDTVTMSGSLSSANGNGTGEFMVSARRLVNKGWLELDVGAGNGPVVGLKGSRNLTSKIFCNGGATVNFVPNGIIPGIVGSAQSLRSALPRRIDAFRFLQRSRCSSTSTPSAT